MKRVRLTEEQLRTVIQEAVEDILDDLGVSDNELGDNDRYQPFAPEMQQ